jgi:hypothetical protein
MVLPTYPRLVPLHGAPARESRILVVVTCFDAVGRSGLHQSGLTSTCFTDCPFPGPRRNDLTIYWALGPLVRSFTLPVDPGDICPPHMASAKLHSQVFIFLYFLSISIFHLNMLFIFLNKEFLLAVQEFILLMNSTYQFIFFVAC